jgi:CRISPR-associated exonuclease Cas4
VISRFELDLALLAVALVLIGVGAAALRRRSEALRWGAPVAFDDGARPPVDLYDARLGLAGRPDEIRRTGGGLSVPVEVKTRRAPQRGVYPSHRVQVEAYALLLETTTGRAPAYGIVSYGDGVSRAVPWNAAARQEVLATLALVRGPYDGRATPTPGKCAGCRWRERCDVRADRRG